MSRETDADDHYHLNGDLPADIPDNLKEFLVEDEEGLTYEEVVLQQACVFESYQENGTNRVMNVNDSDDDDDHIYLCDSTSSEDEGESSSYQENDTNRVVVVVHDHDDDDDRIHIHDSSSSEDEGESSRDGSVNSQEAMDEAFARSLQELGEEFDEFFIAEFNAGPRLNREDVDTDNMRYEELVDLTEAVGVETVGLSAVQISQLPVSTYTSRMFSSNDEETCAICQESFKIGEQIITLPCVHLYYKQCINKWLNLKKNCPMCQKEVV
ncbi:E3 ubiquitin ligase BIG BROTHER-related-like isoform X1 [Bidens hawaiensis]|uniref:E3 ubiquitin ligase BIG BROTHER-related-like isoform X1 n=1 Tax=Bidens hawaiensis TaxID=980011 RepID=UPI00404B4B4A